MRSASAAHAQREVQPKWPRHLEHLREPLLVEYTHPHPDPAHVMRCYRGYLMKAKRQFGGCRSLIHYRRLLDEYLAAKRLVVRRSA